MFATIFIRSINGTDRVAPSPPFPVINNGFTNIDWTSETSIEICGGPLEYTVSNGTFFDVQ